MQTDPPRLAQELGYRNRKDRQRKDQPLGLGQGPVRLKMKMRLRPPPQVVQEPRKASDAQVRQQELALALERLEVVLVRLRDLPGLNARLGRTAVDDVLLTVVTALQAYPESVPGCRVGRLNGGDFALWLPAEGVAAETAHALAEALRASLPAFGPGVQVAPGEGGLVEQHEHVEGIAVLAQRPGDEAVVGRVGHRREEAAVQPHVAGVVVDLVLVARAARDLHHHLEDRGGRLRALGRGRHRQLS